jgi:hypothetical protein
MHRRVGSEAASDYFRVAYLESAKSGDTGPADGVILREAPRKALRPAGEPGADRRISTLGAPSRRLRLALARETPPVSDKDPSVGARDAARSRRFGEGAFLRMTVRFWKNIRGFSTPSQDSRDRPQPLFLGSSRIALQDIPAGADSARICHFEGAPHETLPNREALRATEKSTLRFLVAFRRVPNQPCPAPARPQFSTAAASCLARADSRFLGPATSGARNGGQRGRASE